MNSRAALGAYGEGLAADHLRRQGLVILDRNWRCETGEIDIVAREGNTLVICEVKTRRSHSHGSPLEAVGPKKLTRLRALATRYILDKRIGPKAVRFDVVGIVQPFDAPPQLTHLRGVEE
jgi:putative endonuclease